MNRYGPASDWTDERDALLKLLRAKGYSSSQIAAELGGVTRSAVLGRAYRLGLATPLRRGTLKSREEKAASQRRAAEARRAQVAIEAKRERLDDGSLPPLVLREIPEDHAIPLAQRCTLFQLTEKTCHYGVGDPKEPGFFFCGGATKIVGRKTIHGELVDVRSPYCEFHHGICHQLKPNISDSERERRKAFGQKMALARAVHGGRAA